MAEEAKKKAPGPPIPLGDIHLSRRGDGTAITNVPHAIVYHSPTGLEWGYAGSGPAELALNVLYHYLGDKDLAFEHHQQFKFEMIASFSKDGGIISKEAIEEWIGRNVRC